MIFLKGMLNEGLGLTSKFQIWDKKETLLRQAAFLTLILGLSAQQSQAGVFNTPHLVSPGEFAIGIEPELVMTGKAAVGVNLRYTQGLSELNNFSGIIGTGGGDRGFRVGGNFTFDFFPDIEKQPGIGLAVQALFVELPNAGSVETTAIPYIHKTLKTENGNFEPFLAVPIGLSLTSGTYKVISTVAIGSMFLHSEHLRSVVEFGVSVNNAYTYLSGGLVYYH